MKKITLLIILSFVLFANSTQAQQPKKDVKVGLVLSGGGAKGLAHISVLKAIEQAGVRVDYIGGTSMGAIIGALYASGYTAYELDSIVRTIDFFKVISDDLPRKSKPFYEKESGERYALTLPIRDKKIGIPAALTSGQNVLNLFSTLTQHVNDIEDFNKLPIPFVCIATDLETGKQKVFRSGFLPEVIKASGSFPTLVAPVEIDGKLYSDGGIVNNYPIDEVKAMGADIIIGVDIQAELDTKENLESAISILNQIVGFQIYNTIEEKRERTDILIRPDLADYGVVSFEAAAEIMELGDQEAQEYLSEFKKLAAQQVASPKPKPNTKKEQRFHIKRIDVEGSDNYTYGYVLGKLNLKKRDTTSYTNLIANVNNLYGTGNYTSIQFKINKKSDGAIVKFKLKEKETTNYFQLGAHYDELYRTGILLNGLVEHVFFKNDILSADLILGDNLRYNLNYFVDNGIYTSVGLKSRYNKFTSNVNFEENNANKINLEYSDFTNQLYFQSVFGRRYALGAGVEHKRLDVFTETLSTIESNPENIENGKFYFDKSDYFNGIAFLKIDTYDKSYFQKSGFYFNTNFTWYLASSDYNNNFEPFSQLKGKIGYAHSFSNKVTAHIISEGGFTFGKNNQEVLKFIVGGNNKNYINNFIPMYGYDLGELRDDSYLRTTLTFRYEFLPKSFAMVAANVARVENDLLNEGRIFENTKAGYMAGYGLETFLGPIEIQYSWSPDTKNNYWYFNLGYWF
ncbi:MAG TPA: patatin-like phospholipase family protein [Flavobacteriaceae bacterium]|nr:patatin-like phospholipase family protein [Flavobacteriaceae bacterium]